MVAKDFSDSDPLMAKVIAAKEAVRALGCPLITASGTMDGTLQSLRLFSVSRRTISFPRTARLRLSSAVSILAPRDVAMGSQARVERRHS
jgi:hypothetical protein